MWEQNNRRILWIDCAKVIGMYLVIMGHAGCAIGEFGAFYGAFNMPMFFIISGFLEKECTLRDTFIHGIKTLLIPFVFLYILYTIVFVVSGIIIKPEVINEPFNLIKPFLGIFIGENGFVTKYGIFVCGPLWFVLALFWIKIISNIFCAICRNNVVYYGFLTFLTVFIIITLKRLEINLPLSLDSATLSFPFFAIGQISKKFSMMKEKTILENLIIAIVLFTILFFTYKINLGIDVNKTKFGNNIFIFYILAVIGSFAVINFSMAIYKTEIPLITLISKGMIIILAAHWYFTTAIGVLEIHIENILLKIMVPLIILFICIIPVIISKKYFPSIIGGRK